MSGVDPFTSSREEVRTLTKTAALQLAEKGIRVNAILPGLVATEINKNLFENEKKRKEKENQIPFHRIGRPEEVGKIALFLASDDANYITGSLIYADGGLSLPRSNYFLESEIEKDSAIYHSLILKNIANAEGVTLRSLPTTRNKN